MLGKIVSGVIISSLLTFPQTTVTSFANECKDTVNGNKNNKILEDVNEQRLINDLDVQLFNMRPFCNKSYNIDKSIKEYNDLKQKVEERLMVIEEREKQKIIEEQKKYDDNCYYNPYNLTEKSNISIEKCYELLKGTTYQNYEVAESFVNSEKLDVPINTLFLIALTRIESLHGKSNLSQSNNNISSWRTPNRGNGWRYFNSKSHCVDETALLLSNNYLNENGQFYKGKSIWDVNKLYCEENEWADNINKMINILRNS